MKIILKLLPIAILFLFYSCDSDTPPPNSEEQQTDPEESEESTVFTIMALGASRVEGNRPNHESFRFELWKDLVEKGLAFDFIGTRTDQASYPAFNAYNFDIDHQGTSGWTSGQILNNVDAFINQASIPDIVLFSSPGGNDGLQQLPYDQAIQNINQIIDKLQAANPNITIILEQMAPPAFTSPEIAFFLSSIHRDVTIIAREKTTTNSKVITVDMFTDFESNRMLADEIHYNQIGAEFIATQYYNVLIDLLIP